MVVDGQIETLAMMPLAAVGTVAEAIREYTYYGIAWPVSGDATARLYGSAL